MRWVFLAIGFVVGGMFGGMIIAACNLASKTDDQAERARKTVEEDRRLPERRQ